MADVRHIWLVLHVWTTYEKYGCLTHCAKIVMIRIDAVLECP